MVIQDTSNITGVTFEPAEALLTLGSHVTVEVTATDSASNRNKCKFQVSLQGRYFFLQMNSLPRDSTGCCDREKDQQAHEDHCVHRFFCNQLP